ALAPTRRPGAIPPGGTSWPRSTGSCPAANEPPGANRVVPTPLLGDDLDPGPDHLRGRRVQQFRVIRADVVADQRDDLVLVVVAHDVPAFADHLAGHQAPPFRRRLSGPGLVTILPDRLPKRTSRAVGSWRGSRRPGSTSGAGSWT